MDDRDLIRGARAAKLLSERLANDPLLNWVAHVKQLAFLELLIREAWFAAANRAGKTDALAALAASYLRFGALNPYDAYKRHTIGRPVTVVMASPTFDMSRAILQPKMFDNGQVPPAQPHAPFIPQSEILEWNERKRTLRLRNGSQCRFGAYEQGRELWQGFGAQLVGFDEVPPKDIYQECAIRIEAGTSLIIRGALTLLPDNRKFQTEGHWFFGEKVVPWQRNAIPREQLDIITASIYDNPHLGREEIEQLEAMYPPGSIERRIRLGGELLPGMLGAVAYGSFDRQIHVNPKLEGDPNTFVNFRAPLVFCFDSNIEPAVVVVCQAQGDFVRVLDEIVLETGTTRELAEAYCLRFPVHGAALHIYGDATSKKRTAQTGKSDYDLLLEVFRRLPYPVRLFIPPCNPPVRDRINAMNYKLLGRGGVVGMEIAPHCVELIGDLEQVQRSADGGIKKARDKRDPYYRRTHTSDALGYYISSCWPVGVSKIMAHQPTSAVEPMPGASWQRSRR